MSPSRTGRRALARLAGELGERELAVLGSVAAHRFLTTRQIEALHFADRPTPLAAARAARRLLTRLHELRVLDRLARRVGGIRAGSAAYVWTLGPTGDRLLRQTSGDGGRRRFHEPSVTFLRHTLAVADTHVALVQAERAGVLELVGVELEPHCWRTFLGPSGTAETLRPDLSMITGHDAYEVCWFVEVDLGTESLPTLVRKCQQYDAYRRSGLEQQRAGTFPLVVWIVPGTARRDKLTAAIARARGLRDNLFRVVVSDDFVALVAQGIA